ncbi:chondroitin sulfate proteoglycan 4 [Menidia menidia]
MSVPQTVLVGAFLTLLLCLPGPGHGESYFGDSFCSLQVIQDVRNFQLTLQIKTSRRSGLLLLAAGMEDYLFLELLNGKIQARMNLGGGEIKLSSSQGVQLNNLLYHKVSLTWQDGKLTMIIDDLFPTYVPVNDDGELNIDLGIWLGGTSDLDAPYLSNAIPPFRGCMTDTKFESHQFDILSGALKQCSDTKESCSSEFEIGDGEATSFSTPDSFVSFPTWSEATDAPRTVEFLMKTTIEDALLIFHPGRESDFIAIGVVKGYLRGVLDLGDGMKVLQNTQVQLDDDQWHRVKVQVSQVSFVLTVDSQSSSLSLDSSQKLDLVGNLYLGGIQAKMKEVFRESGSLKRFEDDMTSESFIGCLGEIKVNQKDRSLQDALVTKDVHVKCEGEDYDYSTYYDAETTTTSPTVRFRNFDSGLDELLCDPTQDMPQNFKNVTKLLDLTTLLVPEGGEAFLGINNLSPTFDVGAAGMRLSQIVFTLQEDPWYGLVDMNINTRRTRKFTLLDVANKKIKYMHDGNERHVDQIQLEVVANSNDNLPECLKTPHQIFLTVEILPVNDIPELSGGEISITENGRTRLHPNLMKIMDSDPRCDEIVITLTSELPRNVGYVENAQGKPISQFTCRELKDGNIFFVHRGGAATEITFEVSYGQAESQSSALRLSVTHPHMTIITNTGLSLSQGSNASIGFQNLAIIAHPRNGDIMYNITHPLIFGEIQIESNDGTYKKVTAFHQSDVDQARLRYLSTDSGNHEDIVVERIQFDTHLGQFSLFNNTFLVKIFPAQVKVSNLVELEIMPGEEKIIGPTHLQAEVKSKNLHPETIKYIIVKPPTSGSLRLSEKVLSEGDIFTQKDVMDNALSYKVSHGVSLYGVQHFQFRVFAEGQYSPLYDFPISMQSSANLPVLINERLVVLQGGEQTLNKDHLWLQSPSSTNFVYQVTQEPKHGRLIRDSPPGMSRFEGAIRVFSNEDLLLGRLIYKHDSSKTKSDEFHFLATEKDSDAQITMTGVFSILIQSKNEHAPVRIVDKVFNVVRHGQRLLTTDVIQFKDDDSGFNETQIVYAREGILSGNIVSASNPSQPLFRFTQADLRDKKVLFIHTKAYRERFTLQVSDGFHKTTALLQIQAGEPYLRVANNTIIVIDHGSTKTLDTTLLSAESNLDIRDDSEIKFLVTTPPSDGRIIVSGIEASEFTQEDLKKGVVSYEHNYESMRSKDSFSFTVQAKEHSDDGTFRIRIFKQGYLSEPEVITNEVILSFESEPTVISKDHLKVEQADILPTEMVFTIKESPLLGHVVMLINRSDTTASPVLDYIQSFTQEDIDEGRVLYLSTSIQGDDSFTVDISNGFTTVENLRIPVNIVPRLIPIQTFNFSVKEGLSKVINSDIINISHPFYSSADIEFYVEEPPQHGVLRYPYGDDLTYFRWDEVKNGKIFYMHDTTETTEDNFTITASVYEYERRSLPITITVTIIPVNDEPPQLMRNTGLEVLAGEEADITSSMLSTEDDDTPIEELVYNIEMPINGMVALKEKPEEGIHNFTQAQINNGEVIFIHKEAPNADAGGFSFTVTDGEHTSPLYKFVVTARSLTISVVDQEELIVFPGTRQPITSANLGAKTNEDGNEINFLLVRPPRLGRLILANERNQYEEISQFSQSQLESGVVYYEHQMPPEPFWVVRDFMEFILSSHPAQNVNHLLPITISYFAANSNISSQLWKNKGLDIVQGQRKTIDSFILDASNLLASLPEAQQDDVDVEYEIKRFPSHGRITLGSQDLPRNAPYFLQEDVSQGKVEYLHDDSSATVDSFSFRARLKSEGRDLATPAQSVVLEEVFQISVKRRGSEAPELVTTDMLLEVTQGSMTILTQNHLNTQDEDSLPDEVQFKITKAPSNGQLVNSLTKDPLAMFTQEMVNRGLVGFNSDGSLAESSVEFILSDGEHQTEPYVLNIGILARTLLFKKAPEIKVKQGDDETVITEEMLRASTGGPVEEEILYKITSVPRYAAVMVDRQPTSAFTQKQIKEGRVSVRFIKSTSPRDSASFTARSRAANVSSVLNFTVQPLADIAQGPLLPRGALVQLDRKLLDASPLANKTRTSPTFTIIKKPRGARFVRSRGPDAGQLVESFTQKDLDEGHVAMEILHNESGSKDETTQDEVHFLLKAHGVPPAECVLSFQMGPYNSSGVYPATLLRIPSKVPSKGPNKSGSHHLNTIDWPVGGAITTAPPGSHGNPRVSRRSSFWSILIPILVVLSLLLLAAVLAYFLIRKNKTGKHNVQTAASKPKNGEVAGTETFRKTDPANNIPMSNVESKDTDPELLQHCRTTNPALKKNQYWV